MKNKIFINKEKQYQKASETMKGRRNAETAHIHSLFCTPEQAAALWELGVRRLINPFMWVRDKSEWGLLGIISSEAESAFWLEVGDGLYPAYTVSDLLEILSEVDEGWTTVRAGKTRGLKQKNAQVFIDAQIHPIPGLNDDTDITHRSIADKLAEVLIFTIRALKN